MLQKSCLPNRNWVSMAAKKKRALQNSHSAIIFNGLNDLKKKNFFKYFPEVTKGTEFFLSFLLHPYQEKVTVKVNTVKRQAEKDSVTGRGNGPNRTNQATLRN